MLPVSDGPVEHSEIFLTTGRCQIDEIRDIREQGDVIETGMGHIIHTFNAAPEHKHKGRIVVDAEVLRKLVVGSLDERAVHSPNRFSSTLGNSRCQSDRRFFRNSDIDKLPPGLFPALFGKSEYGRCTGGNGYKLRV